MYDIYFGKLIESIVWKGLKESLGTARQIIENPIRIEERHINNSYTKSGCWHSKKLKRKWKETDGKTIVWCYLGENLDTISKDHNQRNEAVKTNGRSWTRIRICCQVWWSLIITLNLSEIVKIIHFADDLALIVAKILGETEVICNSSIEVIR